METQNIYKKSEAKDTKQPVSVDVDLTMAQARTRTIRNTLAFIGLVLVVLGLASWLVYRQEKRQEASDPSTNLEYMATFSLQSQGPTNPPALPPPTQLAAKAQPSFADAAPKLDPALMAQAMGEVRIGHQYLMAQDFEKAEIHARKALDIYPDINPGQRLLGLVCIHRGQFDQAVAFLEKALKTDPFNPETYNNLATAYIQKRLFEKAEESLETALQLQPGYVPAYFNLGLLNLAAARYDAAADYLEQALDRYPNNPTARNNLAVALVRIGRMEEARRQLLILIQQQPDMAAAYFNMAITYGMEDNVAEAMNWIRQGSDHCTPVVCQKFLSDSDFNTIRQTPEFQQFYKTLYPDAPSVATPR